MTEQPLRSFGHWLLRRSHWLFILVLLPLPLFDAVLPAQLQIADLMRPVFIFCILGMALNVITGYTGLLNLGIAAFMAIGAYSYGILTCDIYPFQLGFWLGIIFTVVIGALAGILLGLPTLRLRGDYLAIVTLGFCEIVQDSFKNLDVITKGIQGINPLPYPTFFGYQFTSSEYRPWYYLLLAILALLILISRNLERSRIGRSWIAIREDELAATCMGIVPLRAKLSAFAFCAAIASLSGALWASSLGSTGEPSNYDFQISILALCIVIVGGMGNVGGVVLGALLMVGFNSILLVKLSKLLADHGIVSSSNVFTSPNNWKYIVFGLALILTMRFRPEGLIPSRIVRGEMHHAPEDSRATLKENAP
jgi:branched-chain amino acid transport system permease protein